MKAIKSVLVFLFFVALSGFLLSFLLPASQKLEKTVTIQAPAALVYEQLSKLELFNNWSVWARQDSSANYALTGTDGTVGASSSWNGDPRISGKGKITITALVPAQQVSHSIEFTAPRKAKGKSVFTLREMNGLTTVTWNFEMATPRPWNIFNLFYSLDKEMGKDFDKGLLALKELAESKNGNAPQARYLVQEMDFPATRFALIRQQVKWSDITAFFGQHIELLYQETAKHSVSPGSATGLYFTWDEKNQLTDMAAAVPVPAGAALPGGLIRTEDIPASKAVFVNYTGGYAKIGEAHGSLDQYLAEKKLVAKKPVIEQYLSGPLNEKDTSKWLTKVVYLVE